MPPSHRYEPRDIGICHHGSTFIFSAARPLDLIALALKPFVADWLMGFIVRLSVLLQECSVIVDRVSVA